jgi:RHS repeat-associated protein
VFERQYTFYTPELNLMSETTSTSTDATPVIAFDYVWFGGQPLAQIDNATGNIAWYFNDHLGTPIRQTDDSGRVLWNAEYEPYGTIYAIRRGEARHQPLRLPGQTAEEGSDLYQNVFRFYRAGWGRYTQADPASLAGGINLFGYSRDNPTRNTDPLGLTSWNCSIGIIGGSSPIGPGAIFVLITCDSACVNNENAHAVLFGSAVGLSAGLPINISAFKTTVEDNDTSPNPQSLGGIFFYGSAGVAVGAGGGYSQVVIGSAKSQPSFSQQRGLNGGIDSFGGVVAVTSSKTQRCCGN